VLRLTTSELVPRPVPTRLTVWGLPVALSVMVNEAVRVPLAVGLKVTLMAQLPLAATELPQLLVWAKSPAFVPVMAMLVRLKEAPPVLVRVTVSAALTVPTAWLAKLRLAAERLTVGELAAPEGLTGDPAPMPERRAVWMPPLALSDTLSKAQRMPAAVGVNVMLTAQLPSDATEVPQVLVSAKSPGSAPVIPRLEMFKTPLPTFLTVMV